jgi:hypothetical protein
MATSTVPTVPPDHLVSYFKPEMAPTFELVEQSGSVRLWRSTAQRHRGDGPHESTRFHITEGDEATVMHMPSESTARANFALAAGL